MGRAVNYLVTCIGLPCWLPDVGPQAYEQAGRSGGFVMLPGRIDPRPSTALSSAPKPECCLGIASQQRRRTM
jgi:hypothetical protein